MRVLVAGVGFAGLLAAWRLARAGRQVTVLRARDPPGGPGQGFLPTAA